MLQKAALSFVFLFSSSLSFAQNVYWSSKTTTSYKNDYCNMTATVPQILIANNGVAMNSLAAQRLNQMWANDLVQMVQEYEGAINDPNNPDACTDYMYSTTRDYRFELKTPLNAPIASVLTQISTYDGGAHGMYVMSAQVINLFTTEIYTLPDLLNNNSKTVARLKELTLERLKYNDGFDETFGWNDWSASVTSLSQITQFYITEYGLVLFFNPYEVGSYAEGLYEVTVEKDFLMSEGLVKSGSALEAFWSAAKN